MGRAFKYIDDVVLPRHGQRETCEFCGRDVLVFEISIAREHAPSWPEALCVRCIQTIPLRWIDPKDDERLASSLINERHPKGTKSRNQRFTLTVELADEYRRIPWLPNFIQGVDWPRCCGDFTEFLGDAGKTYRGSLEGFEWWGYKYHGALEEGIEGCMASDDPVSLFRCLTCAKKFWTWQTT